MHILYGSSINRNPYLIGILIQKFALGEVYSGSEKWKISDVGHSLDG